MKNKIIAVLTIGGIISTSNIAFANDIKILKKNNDEFIPIKKTIQKFGGRVDISKNTAKIVIDGKRIFIEKNLSFAKINDNYYPLNKKEINGIEIPVDTKPIFENGEVYIEKNFLKDNKIANYKIEKDTIEAILEKNNKIVTNIELEKKEEIPADDNKSNNVSQINTGLEQASQKTNKKPIRHTTPEKIQKPIIQNKTNTDVTINDNKEVQNNNDKNNSENKKVESDSSDKKDEIQSNDAIVGEPQNDQQPKDNIE